MTIDSAPGGQRVAGERAANGHVASHNLGADESRDNERLQICRECGQVLGTPPPQILTTADLARLLRRDASTIRRWRSASPPVGPPFIPVSGHVTIYLLDDVYRWMDRVRVTPSIDPH